jgi:hypothetical protein
VSSTHIRLASRAEPPTELPAVDDTVIPATTSWKTNMETVLWDPVDDAFTSLIAAAHQN